MMSVQQYSEINRHQLHDVKHWKHMLRNVKNIIFIFNGEQKPVVVCHLYNLFKIFFSISKAKRCSSRNMVYSECASPCPRTCQNPTSTISQCHSQNTECTPGCVCSNETVYDSFQAECIRVEQCTCQYNHMQYQPGDHVSIDCNDW